MAPWAAAAARPGASLPLEHRAVWMGPERLFHLFIQGLTRFDWSSSWVSPASQRPAVTLHKHPRVRTQSGVGLHWLREAGGKEAENKIPNKRFLVRLEHLSLIFPVNRKIGNNLIELSTKKGNLDTWAPPTTTTILEDRNKGSSSAAHSAEDWLSDCSGPNLKYSSIFKEGGAKKKKSQSSQAGLLIPIPECRVEILQKPDNERLSATEWFSRKIPLVQREHPKTNSLYIP